jgi:hypothetical protein
MSERTAMYRAFVHWDYRGANVVAHYGHLSQCGEWVDQAETRHRRTPDWYDTEAEARASKAAEIEAMGRKLLEQADALRKGGVA